MCLKKVSFCLLFLFTFNYLKAVDTLPVVSWKMTKSQVLKKFKLKDNKSSTQLRTPYKLNQHDFTLSFSLNGGYVVAYSMKYIGKSSKQAYKQMIKFFQSQYGPGEQKSHPKFEKFECKQDRNTDLRMMLMKDKLFILVTPKRKF
ncbi:MAG: hypothetical protein KC646_00225 [Candidatus Cloacimonetes bacterium]|nr:hypothetical protein [Candidatus Cloacimonadota bacterium]